MPESEFEALTAALEPWFNKPFNQLAPEIQDRVLRDFPPTAEPGDIDLVNDNPAIRSIRARLPLPAQTGSAWDSFTPDQRRAVARQWDLQHNPANEAIQERLWDLQPEITAKLEQLRSEIDLLGNAPPTLAFDSDMREAKLVRTRLKRKTLKADEAELLAAGPSELRSVVDRLMKAHPDLVSSPEPAAEPMTSGVQEVGAPPNARPRLDQTDLREAPGRQVEVSPLQFRTGEPGRPSTSKHLILDEFQRRVEGQTALPSLAAEARALVKWFKANYAEHQRPTPHTVENNIRQDHLAYKLKLATK